MPFTVTQASSVTMSSPSPNNGAQDLHENLLCIGVQHFLGYQIKMNRTELISFIITCRNEETSLVAHVQTKHHLKLQTLLYIDEFVPYCVHDIND